VRKSFDDCGKKKIIAESVLTSAVGSFCKGSGLWLGYFVRPSFCAGSDSAAILTSVFDTVVSSVFTIVNSVFGSVLIGEEYCREEECCEKDEYCDEKEEQLICGSARAAQAELSAFVAYA
jgi:hypothetical protein